MLGSVCLIGWRNIAAITCTAKTICATGREQTSDKTIVNVPGESGIRSYCGEKQDQEWLGSTEKYSFNPAGTEGSPGVQYFDGSQN